MRFGLTVDFGWPGLRPNAEYTKAALKRIGIDVTVRHLLTFRHGQNCEQP